MNQAPEASNMNQVPSASSMNQVFGLVNPDGEEGDVPAISMGTVATPLFVTDERRGLKYCMECYVSLDPSAKKCRLCGCTEASWSTCLVD
jgi:hypothetical protein